MGKRPVTEDRLLKRLRAVAAVVLIGAVTILPISEAFELPFKNPNFKLDPIVFGTMVGALLLLLGIEAAVRLPIFGNMRPPRDDDEDDADEK